MADEVGYNGALTANGVPIPQRYHDNGDGTWSLEENAAGGAGGDSTISGPLGRKADALSVSTALSTEDVALLNSVITLLTTQAGYLDGLEAGQASILAKLLAAPATEAKQDTGNTSLASILATAGATNGAAVITDTNGTQQQYLRGIVTLWLAGLKAGEAHIGQIAAYAIDITPTITVDTAVYAAGDTIGGILTLSNALRLAAKPALLQSMHILDRSNQKPTGNFLFFNASPAAATTTDNAAFVYSTDDLKEVARVPVVNSDYVTVNSKAVANLPNLGRQMTAASGRDLFVVFVTDGAPDFIAGTDFQVIFSFM